MGQSIKLKTFLSFMVLLSIFWIPSLSYGAWGPWNNISGWIGLDYRLQSKHLKSNEWKFSIQFRNRYSQKMNFDVNILNGRGNNRVSVKENKKTKATGYFTGSNYISFTIDKVKFGIDNAFGEYETSDEF